MKCDSAHLQLLLYFVSSVLEYRVSTALGVPTSSWLHRMWQLCARFLVSEIVTGVSRVYSRYSQSLNKKVRGGGAEDETAVSSIQLEEIVPGVSMWLSSVEPLLLLYGSYCLSLCVMWVQIASEGEEDEKAAVCFISIYEREERDGTDSSVVEEYS